MIRVVAPPGGVATGRAHLLVGEQARLGRSGEVCICDLAAGVDLAESTVSHHLGQLRKAGMVESERRGMNVYHRARAESLEALRVVLDPNCCR